MLACFPNPYSLGRKFWLVEASFQMLICEVIVGTVIGQTMDWNTQTIPEGATIALLVFICLFIAGHAWGWGPMVSPTYIASTVREIKPFIKVSATHHYCQQARHFLGYIPGKKNHVQDNSKELNVEQNSK